MVELLDALLTVGDERKRAEVGEGIFPRIANAAPLLFDGSVAPQ